MNSAACSGEIPIMVRTSSSSTILSNASRAGFDRDMKPLCESLAPPSSRRSWSHSESAAPTQPLQGQVDPVASETGRAGR